MCERGLRYIYVYWYVCVCLVLAILLITIVCILRVNPRVLIYKYIWKPMLWRYSFYTITLIRRCVSCLKNLILEALVTLIRLARVLVWRTRRWTQFICIWAPDHWTTAKHRRLHANPVSVVGNGRTVAERILYRVIRKNTIGDHTRIIARCLNHSVSTLSWTCPM